MKRLHNPLSSIIGILFMLCSCNKTVHGIGERAENQISLNNCNNRIQTLMEERACMNGSGDIPRNMQALIDQMKQMNERAYEYKPATETGRDYIDIMCHIYKYTKIENQEIYQAQFPIFAKNLKRLLEEHTPGHQILREAGLTDLDIALLNNDTDYVKRTIEEDDFFNNKGWSLVRTRATNGTELVTVREDKDAMIPYRLAKKYRMLEIAKDMYATQGGILSKCWKILDNHVEHLRLPLSNGEERKLGTLSNYTGFSIYESNRSSNKKNMLVYMQGDGCSSSGYPTWDYNLTTYNYKQLNALFDTSMIMGDGTTHLIREDYDTMIKKLKDLGDKNLDFVLIHINIHDSNACKTLESTIDALPGGLAKETLYVIKACNSGQYHQNWGEKDAILITSCGEDEYSYTYMLKPNEMSEIFKDKIPNVENFAKLYNKITLDSIPYISGKWLGRPITKTTVKEYLEKLEQK